MKYYITLLLVICIFGLVFTAPTYDYDIYVPNQQLEFVPSLNDLDTSFIYDELIDNLSSDIIENVVSGIVLNLVFQIEQFVPDNSLVNVPTLFAALESFGDPSVGEVFDTLLTLVGVDSSYLWQILPSGLLALQLDSYELLRFLSASIPLGTVLVPFPYIADLFSNYLSKLLINILAD